MAARLVDKMKEIGNNENINFSFGGIIMKKLVSILVLFLLIVASVFGLSKQQARRIYISGYNSGYDDYEPYSGYPDVSMLKTIYLRQIVNAPEFKNYSDTDKLSIANLLAEGYQKGFLDHSRRIRRDPDAAWDNTRWAWYGAPNGIYN